MYTWAAPDFFTWGGGQGVGGKGARGQGGGQGGARGRACGADIRHGRALDECMDNNWGQLAGGKARMGQLPPPPASPAHVCTCLEF